MLTIIALCIMNVSSLGILDLLNCPRAQRRYFYLHEVIRLWSQWAERERLNEASEGNTVQMCSLSREGMEKSLWIMLGKRCCSKTGSLGFFGIEEWSVQASKTNTVQRVWTHRKVKQNTHLCWIRHHHTHVFPRTRPMRTGSGPLYSSITKNWFQSQLLRWRERGPPSSDSVTHFVLCRVLWSRMPLTPVSKWRSGRLACSSELGARLRALITPSTSSLVKVLLFLRFRVSSRLCSANRDLAAMSALKPKLFGFPSVLGRVLALPLTFWCGISESFKFDSKWGKSRCGGLHGTCRSRSSFKRPAATTGTCRSMKRTSRTKRAAIAAMTRSLCFKGKSLLGWWGSASHGGPSRLEPSPSPLGQGFISAPSVTLAHADPTTWGKSQRRSFKLQQVL